MSATIDGTAVARIVASIAISPVESITAMSTGPRSERNPTAEVLPTFLPTATHNTHAPLTTIAEASVSFPTDAPVPV